MRDKPGYIKPKYVEEEIEDEDDLKSDDDENLGEDLSVTTKSPTPSPLGSPAGLSSSYLSQEPNEFPMPKTPVKDGLPIADGTLLSAESPEHDPMVPKRRRIESPSSTEAASSANTQKGQSAGCSSPNGSSVPNKFAKPTLVKLQLPPIPAGSFKGGPIVPKRPRIESPSSTVPSSSTNAQIAQSQPAGFSSPNRSPVPAGSSKTNGNAYPVLSALLNKTSFPAKCAKPTRNPMTSVPPTPELIAFAARWSETHAKISRISLLMGSGFRAGHEFAARFAEIQSHLAQASLLMRGSLPDDLKPPIPAAGLSNPAGSHQRQFQSTIAGSIQSSVPAGSPEKNKDQISFGPRIPVSAISCSAGSHQGQSQLATTDTSMESSVPSGQKQADGLLTAVGSSNDNGKSFPASLSNPNKLLLFTCPPKYSFCKDFKQSIEEIEADRRMARLVPKGSKKPNGDSVAPNLDGLLEELSQLDPVAIESSVRATPELVNDHVNAVESPISVDSLSPTASFDQNELPMTVRSPTRTEASFLTESFEEATAASPIQSSVPNESEHVNGLAIVVESPNTVGNGSAPASSDQNGLSIGSPRQTETSSPAASLEDGSDKSNGNPVALEPLTPATNMSVSAGSRERPAQQDTSGSAEPHKLPLTVKTAIPAGVPNAENSEKAGSTEPNKLPTTAGSKFHPFQAFWEGLQSVDWKEVHSCLSGILSLTVDFPNGPVPLSSLLPDQFTSIVDGQPSPGSAAGPTAETSSATVPEPKPEENGSESKTEKMEDEKN
ncbi:hypothetical protein B9Z55_022616 [Caenorhabditis nigoni]|nr:hypothetical protein B9Z55_022616 [Caenorhabditis nigoni]